MLMKMESKVIKITTVRNSNRIDNRMEFKLYQRSVR